MLVVSGKRILDRLGTPARDTLALDLADILAAVGTKATAAALTITDNRLIDATSGLAALRAAIDAIATSIGIVIRSLSTNATALTSDDVLLCTGGAGGITVTLYAIGGAVRELKIKKIDAGVGAITIAAAGGDTIDGQPSIQLTTQWQAVTLVSDGGNNWAIF